MRKDLSKLEKQNAEKFNDVRYLHGFRFGVLEGYDEGYEQGRADEQAFVEKRCKELGIDYILIYTCDSAD